MKGDQMGIDPANPRPRELPLSNQTRFKPDQCARPRHIRSCKPPSSFCILPQADEMRCGNNAHLASVPPSRCLGEVLMETTSREDAAPIATGVPGLDDILAGGYAANRAHLVEGRPGSGKTTLGLQFLLEGLRHGELCLYISMCECKRELHSIAERHGW